MTEKYTLLVGLNDKDTKVQKVSTLDAYKVVMNIITPHTEGATIYEAFGYYKHDNGDIVQEKSLHIEILFFDDNESNKKVHSIVDNIKIVLNQESVAVTHSIVNSDLW